MSYENTLKVEIFAYTKDYTVGQRPLFILPVPRSVQKSARSYSTYAWEHLSKLGIKEGSLHLVTKEFRASPSHAEDFNSDRQLGGYLIVEPYWFSEDNLYLEVACHYFDCQRETQERLKANYRQWHSDSREQGELLLVPVYINQFDLV